MKTLERNKTKFYYARYYDRQPVLDDNGNPTGEYEVGYDLPKPYFANISAAKGETQTRWFGDDIRYDRVIVFDNDVPPINEYTVLWIDSFPEFDKDGALVKNEDGEISVPHDYIIKAVARSLNSVSIAVSKVNVSKVRS